MMTNEQYQDLLPLAIKATLMAGAMIQEVYERDDFEVQLKSDNSPVTIADKKASAVIVEQLTSSNLPVLSEEEKHQAYEERKAWDCFWLVDPLDGTKEFIKRNGEFTVNIALVEGQIPKLGVIYSPVLKQLYYATPEEGAFKVDGVLPIQGEADFDWSSITQAAVQLPDYDKEEANICRVVASRSHLSKETQEFAEGLKEKYEQVEFVSIGSSLKMCLVAEGRADVYPRFGPCMEWDTGAGHALINAVGGSVTKVEDDAPLAYNKEDLLNPWFICVGANEV